MASCALVAALALSAHMGLQGEYNGIHPALKCDRDDSGLIGGAFLNSEDRVSVYGGWKLSSREPGHDLWAEIGIVTGYTGGDVLPYARVGLDLLPRASLFLAPAIEGDGQGGHRWGAVLGIELRLNR